MTLITGDYQAFSNDAILNVFFRMKTECKCDGSTCGWTPSDLTCLEEPTTTPVSTTNNPEETTEAEADSCQALEEPNGFWECTDGNEHDTKDS